MLVHQNRARPFAALITLAIVGGTQQACTLRVHVDGLRNRKGVVGTPVFTSAVGWPEDVHKSFRHQYAPVAATGRSATVVMKDLPPGNYGIVVLHDKNENMKLDRNIFGFANNPNVGLQASPFASAVMHVACIALSVLETLSCSWSPGAIPRRFDSDCEWIGELDPGTGRCRRDLRPLDEVIRASFFMISWGNYNLVTLL